MAILSCSNRCLWIATITVGMFALNAYAEPQVTTKYIHYNIYPKSLADIRKEMKKHSPIKSNGRTFYGNTKWNVRWEYQLAETENNCRIDNAETFIHVTYTLPRIPVSHQVDNKVREVFKDYYLTLVKHERNHGDSGLFAAQDIKSTLLNMGSFKTCRQLNQTANANSRNIIKEYNQRDIKYDKKTKNGRTEGLDLSKYR